MLKPTYQNKALYPQLENKAEDEWTTTIKKLLAEIDDHTEFFREIAEEILLHHANAKLKSRGVI